MTDYKATLNLPQTDFPMRGNLANREPETIAKWQQSGLYEKIIAKRKDAPRFIFHDGPPYANGNIHHGHILNKVLKDFVVKYQNMNGKLCEFVPGWDCHGLPIENEVDKKLGKKKHDMSKVEIREACRDYAAKYVKIQAEEFKRMMIFADWENPYVTMSTQYESATVRELGRFMEQGLVYKGLKPVHWDWASRTALAEAEVEYGPHTTEHVYVKFKMDSLPGDLDGYTAGLDPYMVIWTTTPWTLPANLAIALHPELDYVLMQNGTEVYVVAEGLYDSVVEACKLAGVNMVMDAETGEPVRFQGREIVGELGAPKGLSAKHPFIDRDSVLLPADYVTTEQGTGCVHTAPGHGQEDFVLGQEHGLETYCPVDFRGCYIEKDVPEWAGMHVYKANPLIVEKLHELGALLNHVGDKMTIDRYPHGWRSKKPVIFRATAQWFIAMEPESAGNPDGYRLRDAAIAEIDKVDWVPKWGRDRIFGMVENRPDWCISRQRVWGCPITVMSCGSCGEAIVDHKITYHVADIIRDEGADAWFGRPATELVPEGYVCPHCGADPEKFDKESDILDVWFDSGTSWSAVLNDQLGWGHVADLYLEGSDQHRGWFQSSLMTSLGSRGQAPFKACLTHGFVMNTEGKKYSKSQKNYEAPEKMINQLGAEILRLWVAAVDYRGDIMLSSEVLKRVTDAYRKIRNTIRYLLGSLEGFDPKSLMPLEELEEPDKWVLHRSAVALEKIKSAYDTYQFHQIFRELVQLCTTDLSSVHMDISKDRMYCSAKDSDQRRSGQTAYYLILHNLLRAAAPVLSFTAEEAWDHLPSMNGDTKSVHLSDYPTDYPAWKNDELDATWEQLLAVRSDVQKALEEVRVPKKEKKPGQIGSSQEAHVSVTASGKTLELLKGREAMLPTLFIVSGVDLIEGDVPEGNVVGVSVTAATNEKCERCWNHWIVPGTGATICPRCTEVVPPETTE